MSVKIRAAAYIRLSSYRGDRDPTTSPERQREACQAYALAKGWEVVEVVEDLDVSGSDRGLRLDRPGLKRLRELYPLVDVVIFAKLDRLARNVRDFASIAEEAREHEVALVSVAESLDLSTPTGRFVSTILAAFAEMEAATIAERTQAGKAAAKRLGRYMGGPVRFGYRVADNPDGGGRILVPDPEAAPLVREMVSQYIEGTSFSSLARQLNARGVRTMRGYRWGKTAVRQVLIAHSQDSSVLSGPERHALAEALDMHRESFSNRPAFKASALLTGVLTCATCGTGLTKNSGGKKRGAVYVCPLPYREPSKEHARVSADGAEKLVTERFLADLGDWRPAVRVIPAEEYDLKLVALADEANELREQFVTTPAAERAALLDRLAKVEEEHEALKSSPPPRVAAFRRGEETLAQIWERSGVHERRDLLKQYVGGIPTLPARDENGRTRTTEERIIWPDVLEWLDDEGTGVAASG